MEATIRIQTEGEPQPQGGFVGALTGGTTPGSTTAIEVDLRDATGGDVALMLPQIAEAYRLGIHGERTLTEEFVGETIPFPEAGDPHPFERPEEGETPESVSQGGTPQVGDEITTAAAWNALPYRTILLDRDGDSSQVMSSRGRDEDLTYQPYTVIWIPTDAERKKYGWGL